MYIEVTQREDGKHIVKITGDDVADGNRIDLQFITPQVVALEVGASAKVLLARTRTNGIKTQIDPGGTAWLTGNENRLIREIRPRVTDQVGLKRCHKEAKQGTGTGICEGLLDVHGNCMNAGRHVNDD